MGMQEDDFPWHLGVYDAHCHPTDTVSSLANIPGMKTKILTIMATRGQDQGIVAEFADKFVVSPKISTVSGIREGEAGGQGRLIPCFGWHPWFSHQIYDDISSCTGQKIEPPHKLEHYRKVLTPVPDDEVFLRSLPVPRPLTDLLAQIRGYLEQFPVALVGEIGLDRSFRIPVPISDENSKGGGGLTPGGREGRELSPFHVDLGHQQRILEAQLRLAGELKRAVSVHGVAAHGIVFETLSKTWRGFEKPVLSKRALKQHHDRSASTEVDDKLQPRIRQDCEAQVTRPYPPRICLHSYSGPPDTLKLYLQPNIPVMIFFSFSYLVNFSLPTSKKVIDVIRMVPDNRVLVESDLHAAGTEMDDLMEKIVRTICKIKGWSLENGTEQLGSK